MTNPPRLRDAVRAALIGAPEPSTATPPVEGGPTTAELAETQAELPASVHRPQPGDPPPPVTYPARPFLDARADTRTPPGPVVSTLDATIPVEATTVRVSITDPAQGVQLVGGSGGRRRRIVVTFAAAGYLYTYAPVSADGILPDLTHGLSIPANVPVEVYAQGPLWVGSTGATVVTALVEFSAQTNAVCG